MASLDSKGLTLLWNKIRSYINGRLEAISVPVDYIVEEGTSGIWTYRKWASGIAECWGRWEGTITHYVGPYSDSFYGYTTGSIPLPFTFVTLPDVINYNCSVGQAFTMPAQSTNSASNKAITCYMVSVTSGTMDVSVDIDVKGRWK